MTRQEYEELVREKIQRVLPLFPEEGCLGVVVVGNADGEGGTFDCFSTPSFQDAQRLVEELNAAWHTVVPKPKSSLYDNCET